MGLAGKTLRRRRLVYATTLQDVHDYILKARPHNNNPLTHLLCITFSLTHLTSFFSLTLLQQLHLPACCCHLP
jgi:hypothetical protein